MNFNNNMSILILTMDCGIKCNESRAASELHRPAVDHTQGTFLSAAYPFPQTVSLKILSAIQIRWKLRVAVIPLLALRSQQSLHMPRQQLCLVQNFVAIVVCVDVREKRNFHRIWNAIEEPLVKRAPGFGIQLLLISVRVIIADLRSPSTEPGNIVQITYPTDTLFATCEVFFYV